MKVENLFKHRGDSMSKYQSEFMHWVSPTVREYWGEFLHRTNSRQLFSWVRDFHQPAVNEDIPVAEPIQLKPEAQTLYNQLQAQIGDVIHIGDWMTVDQQRINQFGQVTEDMQWIHTDPEKAEVDSPFKTTIAHGFLTLSLLPKLTDSVDPSKLMFPTAKW